ncbi:MAG: hypothetical protein JST84_13990 [Acidobacteria bacterium]|nr:hypothetical protein [Acidobacteriota bacterium]
MNYYRVNLSTSIRSARMTFLFLLFTFLLSPVLANTRSINLAEMTSHAGRIVYGRVVEVREGKHPQHEGIAVTFIKIQVTEMIKGSTTREVSFMQYGNSSTQYIAHMPKYSMGEEIVLFLYPESKLGLTSPVGQGQGKFVVRNDVRSGQRILLNDRANYALFARLDATKLNSKLTLSKAEREAIAQPEGRGSKGLEISAFRSLVRKIATNPNISLQ